MNIIIPIAGANRSMGETEYIKSLQEIERKTVLQYAFESLQSISAKHFIVVIKRQDVNTYHLDNIVKLLRPGAEVVISEGETMGAACTCMLAVDMLDSSRNPNIPSVIILLSDGNTDFPSDSTGALLQQSNANKQDAINRARQNGYPIFSVCLNANHTANTEELADISNAR